MLEPYAAASRLTIEKMSCELGGAAVVGDAIARNNASVDAAERDCAESQSQPDARHQHRASPVAVRIFAARKPLPR